MDKKKLQVFYLVIAFCGIGIALGVLLIVPPDFSGLDAREETIWHYVEGTWSQFYSLGGPGINPGGKPYSKSPWEEKVEVEWRLQPTYPNRAAKNSTILIEAIPEITKIDAYDVRRIFIGKNIPRETKGELVTEEEIRTHLWKDFESGVISIGFHLPSAKIAPEKITSFSKGKSLAWSVYLPIAGVHEGIIVSKIEKAGMESLKQTGETKIKISVFEPLFSVKNILSFVGLTLGSLISIPGIYAFMRERRKDKEEKIRQQDEERRKHEENKPKIIMP